jgi:hypothetical protein
MNENLTAQVTQRTNRFVLVTLVSMFLVIVLVGILAYGIKAFRDHWDKLDTTTLIVRDTLRAEAMSIQDLLKAQKGARKGTYEVSQKEIELLRRYEEHQLSVLNESIAFARNERQSLVDEISMLVGLLTGFLALIGIGLPILNMTLTREELRQDREKYDKAVEKVDGMEPTVASMESRVGSVEQSSDNAIKIMQSVEQSVRKAEADLTKIEKDLDQKGKLLDSGVKLATEAMQNSHRLSILVVQFKLSKALDPKLYEIMKKNNSAKKMILLMLEDLVKELNTILENKDDFAGCREELSRGLMQFAADFRWVDLLGTFRKDAQIGNDLYDAIGNVIKTDHLNDDFWKKLEEMKCKLELYADSLRDQREAA